MRRLKFVRPKELRNTNFFLSAPIPFASKYILTCRTYLSNVSAHGSNVSNLSKAEAAITPDTRCQKDIMDSMNLLTFYPHHQLCCDNSLLMFYPRRQLCCDDGLLTFYPRCQLCCDEGLLIFYPCHQLCCDDGLLTFYPHCQLCYNLAESGYNIRRGCAMNDTNIDESTTTQ